MPSSTTVTVIILVIVAFFVWGHFDSKKFVREMNAVAAKLGLEFSPLRDPDILKPYMFLGSLAGGSKHYAENVIRGECRGRSVLLFDCHYETYTGFGLNRKTHDHHFSYFVMSLEKMFPELTIASENLFDKVLQAIGRDDIDFESVSFSKRFKVLSRNKKFAYDFCSAQMITYLLSQPDCNIEIENSTMAIRYDDYLDAGHIEKRLDNLLTIRSLMPNYLFARQGG